EPNRTARAGQGSRPGNDLAVPPGPAHRTIDAEVGDVSVHRPPKPPGWVPRVEHHKVETGVVAHGGLSARQVESRVPGSQRDPVSRQYEVSIGAQIQSPRDDRELFGIGPRLE